MQVCSSFLNADVCSDGSCSLQMDVLTDCWCCLLQALLGLGLFVAFYGHLECIPFTLLVLQEGCPTWAPSLPAEKHACSTRGIHSPACVQCFWSGMAIRASESASPVGCVRGWVGGWVAVAA